MKLQVYSVKEGKQTVALELVVDESRRYFIDVREEPPAHIRTGVHLDKDAKRKQIRKVEV